MKYSFLIPRSFLIVTATSAAEERRTTEFVQTDIPVSFPLTENAYRGAHRVPSDRMRFNARTGPACSGAGNFMRSDLNQADHRDSLNSPLYIVARYPAVEYGTPPFP